ncbi:MAG: hypothetical protein GXX79_08265 [Actinomycetales bacterium]|nr:hypothetical protein [Actinomycetales bacterium]
MTGHDNGAAGRSAITGAVPLVAAKLVAPALPRCHLDRSRLGALLDVALDPRTRLTLVSAPPGYGKSVAVAGWLASRDVAATWLCLDEADSDLTRFVRYLVAALDRVRPGVGEGTLGLVATGVTPDVDLIGATILDEVASSDAPFVLVLDDYQAIRSEAVDGLVRFLARCGPPFVHLVLLSRSDPRIPLARYRAHDRLVELRADQFRYRPDEVEAYLELALGARLDRDLVERLAAGTEGWPAGLQLAALCLRDRSHPRVAVEDFLRGEPAVFEYLADEVMAGLDEELRTFLTRTSVTGRFTPRLAGELIGRPDVADVLLRAERANLFLTPVEPPSAGQEPRWYRYHPLFADHLRSLLGESERRDLHGRVADHLDRAGLWDQAVEHAFAAGADDRTVRLLERHARSAFEAGELATLLGWLERLPEERVAASPELSSLRPWAFLFTGRLAELLGQPTAVPPTAVQEATATAGQAPQAAGEAPVGAAPAGGAAAGRLLTFQALLATVAGAGAEPLARAAIELLGEDDFFRSLALLSIGMERSAAGDHLPAVELWRAAVDAAVAAGQPTAVVLTVTALASGLHAIGRRDEAEALCRRVLAEYADWEGRPRPIVWFVRMPLGLLRYEAGDLAEARRELELGYAAAASSGTGAVLATWALGELALARQATGAPEAALEACRALHRSAAAAGVPLPSMAGEAEARIRLLQGDLAAAARWADRAPGTPESGPPESGTPESGMPEHESLRLGRDLTVARVRLAQGRAGEAAGLLDRAGARAEVTGVVPDLVSARVLRAAAAEVTGARAEALAALGEAVRLAAPGGYVRRFVDDGAAVAGLLPLVRDVAPAFVDEVVAALDRPTGTGPAPGARRGGEAVRLPGGLLVELPTARELDVLRLLARGASDAEIAEGLVVSLATAKWHVANVRRKLVARSRTQAVVRAQELGLV